MNRHLSLIFSPLFFAVIAYVVTNLAPQTLGAYTEVWKRTVAVDTADLEVICAKLIAFALLSLEIRLLCALCILTERRVGRVSGLLGSFCLVFIFVAYQVVSWRGLYLYGSFPNLGSIAALVSTHVSVFALHLTRADKAEIVRSIGTIGAVGGISWIFLRRVKNGGDFPLVRSIKSEFILIFVVVLIFGVSRARPHRIIDVLRSVESPEVAFTWDAWRILANRGKGRERGVEPLMQIEKWKAQALSGRGELPDVFVVAIEALRADALLHKNQPDTVIPNIHKHSENSTLFTRAYSVSSDTAYALKSIVTGRYAYEGELRQQNYRADVIREVILFDLLQAVGYRTGYFTATDWNATTRLMDRSTVETRIDAYQIPAPPVDDLTPRRGLTAGGVEGHLAKIFSGVGLYSANGGLGALDRATVRSFSDWVRGAPGEKPLFGLVYLVSSHFPWLVQDPAHKVFSTNDDAIIQAFSTISAAYDGETETFRRSYRNALHQVDCFVGDLLHVIRARSKIRPVIIIMLGDHGEAVGQHGDVSHNSSLYDEQVRIPLIVYSSVKPGSRIVDSPVSQVDIAPTILDMVGLPPFNGHQTVSIFSPAVLEARDIYLTLQSYSSMDGLVSWPFKLITSTWGKPPVLFNLEKDPEELIDLSREFPDVSSAMSTRIDDFKATQRAFYGIPPVTRGLLAPPRWVGH